MFLSKYTNHITLSGPRANEGNAQQNLTKLTEGTTSFVDYFDIPLETNLFLERTFDTDGKIYTVTFDGINNHRVGDTAKLTWTVICARPIFPSNWTLEYEPYMLPGETFEFSLVPDNNLFLPTMPKVEVYPVKGRQVLSDLVELSEQEMVPFYYKPDDVDCDDEDSDCTKEYLFEEMGLDPGPLNQAGMDILSFET